MKWNLRTVECFKKFCSNVQNILLMHFTRWKLLNGEQMNNDVSWFSIKKIAKHKHQRQKWQKIKFIGEWDLREEILACKFYCNLENSLIRILIEFSRLNWIKLVHRFKLSWVSI